MYKVMNTSITGYNDVQDKQKIITSSKKDKKITIDTNEKNENMVLTKILDLSINTPGFASLNNLKYIFNTFGSCSISITENRCFLTSSTTKRSYGYLRSIQTIPGIHGIPIDIRFKAIFVPKLNCTSLIGIGDETEGVFFGSVKESSYNTMGILVRINGDKDEYKLTITGASSIAGSIDIELDGVITNVVISNSDTIYSIASNIASSTLTHSTTDDIDNWDSDLLGSSVYFIANRNGSKTGSFSITFNTTDATGTLTKINTGSNSTDSFIPQIEWNVDPGDGSGDLTSSVSRLLPSSFTGNFRIVINDRFIFFYIKDTTYEEYILVHVYDSVSTIRFIKYKPFIQIVDNDNTTTNVQSTLSDASVFLMANIENKLNTMNYDISNFSQETLNVSESNSVVTIKNIIADTNFYNIKSIRLLSLNLGYNSGTFGIVKIIHDPTFTGTSVWTKIGKFTYYSTNSNDISGTILRSYSMSLSSVLNISPLDIYIGPGQSIGISIEPIAGTSISADVGVSIVFTEDS